ncbi:histidine kinase [Streptomyces sp. DSM 44915]|uniref:Histidine kinase n=1 Tax=Streptomyces chisholmiae TaxID=3075540 RepID=A0ABU2JTR3_9ACTN|nr:histidine kinase [Streptomyces sp. DSM 44915]MDT0268377.1 histidine kinase [Streptomyces sp. DSM 44915]
MRPPWPAAVMMFDEVAATQGRLRRLNLAMLLPPLAAVGALLLVLDSRSWWQTAVLALGVLAGLLVIERWSAGDLARFALPCLLVTGAVWLFGVLVADSRHACYGLLIAGPVIIPQLPRHRGAAALGLTLFVAAAGSTRLLVAPEEGTGALVGFVLVPAGVTAMATGLNFVNQLFYKIIQQSREREAELAVMRERVRFASDLHDIQGHTLHVVKLKVTLAEKLLDHDVERARRELAEVHGLVGDTITQTRELAHAQRRLNLPAELENAKNLFEAAGIRVRVDREERVDPAAGELLGQVLRETTTNILRHAAAEQVRITLTGTGITIVNDGAGQQPTPPLRGLAALRERVLAGGGELHAEQRDGRFRTAATFPPPHPDTVPERAGQPKGTP